MNAFGGGRHAEQESGSTVEVLKREVELRAGIFRIDRLVRIEAWFSRSKILKAVHAISDGLAFPESNEILARPRQLTARTRPHFSQLITRCWHSTANQF